MLLADAAQAITNGFVSTFNTVPLRLMCWAHVKANLDKKLNMIKDKNVQATILQEIDILQTANNRENFDLASKLFFQKWSDSGYHGVSEFCNYFEHNWIRINSNWFEGAAPKSPSTNNGLESINRTIKSEITKYERLPLSRFLPAVKKLLAGWSLARNPSQKNAKLFEERPIPSLPLWTSAYHWAESNTFCKKKDQKTFYILSSNSSTETAETTLCQFTEKSETKNWQNFDEYQSWSRQCGRSATSQGLTSGHHLAAAK